MRLGFITVVGLTSVVVGVSQHEPFASFTNETGIGQNHEMRANGPAGSSADQEIHSRGIDVDPDFVRQLMSNDTHYLHKRDNLHPRAQGALGMFTCDGAGWSSECKWQGGVQDGKCRATPFAPGASMGPDKGLHCTLFKALNCPGTGYYPLEWPGITSFDTDVWWAAISCIDDASCRDSPLSYKCTYF